MIIAEIGSNHGGTLNGAIQCIASAAAVGADAVKFQLFSEADLYGPGNNTAPAPGSIHTSWLTQLKEKADANGIEFMCSAFSIPGYKYINPFVRRHKIASPENNHVLMAMEIQKFGKPVIMSCGASHPSDIKVVVDLLSPCTVTLLYCVSAYPCNEIRLEKIDALRAAFPKLEIGLSDHTTDYTCAPVEACRHYKVKVLEKHYNPLGLMDTDDNIVSLKQEEFAEMVKRIKYPASYDYAPERTEQEALLKYNRRLIATADIKKGGAFTINNVGAYRSRMSDASGMSPLALFKLLRCEAQRDYNIGEPISP